MPEPRGAFDPGGGADPIRDAWIVTALMALAGVVRLFSWFQKAVLFDDGPLFLAMADAIREGAWPVVLGHDYHPLYSALIAVAAELGGQPERLFTVSERLFSVFPI